jgi:hypothetical protein
MKKIILVLSLLFISFFIYSFEGIYFATYLGIDTHLELDNISFPKANPYSNVAKVETNVAADFNFDFGYTFYKVPFSIAIGLELNNWVDPNLRLILKYNFLAEKILSPYLYLSVHGGFLDILSYGIHAGFGLDVQATEWFFIGFDVRAGYESESKVQTEFSSTLTASDFENEIEISVSVGAGFKIPTRKLYLKAQEKKQNEKKPDTGA